jgi:hypothetical protein
MCSPGILNYKLDEGECDDSLVNDEQIIHELANGTRMINLSLLRLVRRWNPLFVAHGYTYINVDEGWQYSPSRKNSEMASSKAYGYAPSRLIRQYGSSDEVRRDLWREQRRQ